MFSLAKGLATLLALAVLASPAKASCWSEDAWEAARVRELDTMLMVEALRCRRTTADFLATYNRFVEGSRPALVRANLLLRAHFAETVGPRGALDAYDRYVTAVANRYGAGTAGLACADLASIAAAAAAAAQSGQSLEALADVADLQPAPPGARCSAPPAAAITVAAR